MTDHIIEIKQVSSRRDLSRFIHLPYRIHRNHPQWLPPIREDEWKVFDPKKNSAFAHCDTVLFLAMKKGKVVGRIMGIINHAYNRTKGENHARFSYLECYDEKAVFTSLMQAVEDWAREKGSDALVGPLGFSDKDPQGFLIEGFDDPMTVLITNHSYSFMVDFMEDRGYGKLLDLVQYRFPTPDPLPDVYHAAAERVLNRGYRVIEFTRSKDMKPWVKAVFDLINETYLHIYGFAPLTDEEARDFADRFLPILNPAFIKLIVDGDGVLQAFIIGMPDLSKGLRISRGKLYPFGFIWILLAMRRTRQLNLMLGCIRESRRRLGLDTVLAVRMMESAKKAGFTLIDTHLVMENNTRMRAEYDRIHAELYKKYRIYSKAL